MKNTKISVLGTEYAIIVEEFADSGTDGLQKKALRHEIIHAFLAESGLQANFKHCDQFGHDETMVDWFAIQYHKIGAVYKQLGI